MIVSAFIENILRPKIHDIDSAGYTDNDLLNCVQWGVASIYLGSPVARKGLFVKKHLAIHMAKIPKDFYSFAGKYPVFVENSRFMFPNYMVEDGNTSMDTRYNPLPVPLSLADEIPLPENLIPFLLVEASIEALNRNEFNVTQDVQLADRLTQKIETGVNDGS